MKKRSQKMNPATHGSEGSVSAPVLYAALELSNMTWRLALSDSADCQQDDRMIFHGWPPLGTGYDRPGAEIQRFRKRPENRWVQGAEGSNRPVPVTSEFATKRAVKHSTCRFGRRWARHPSRCRGRLSARPSQANRNRCQVLISNRVLPTSCCGSSLLFDIWRIGGPAALQRGTASNQNHLLAAALAAKPRHDVRQQDQHDYYRAQF